MDNSRSHSAITVQTQTQQASNCCRFRMSLFCRLSCHSKWSCGLQGLADTFIILGMAFDSPEAKQLNKDIFECIYYNALVTSCDLAKVDGETA